MSSAATGVPTGSAPTGDRSRPATAVWLRRALIAAAVVVLLLAPLSLRAFWLQAGLFVMASVVGAIGLTLLVGRAGQLSLGHAFFVAIGAYGYCFLAGEPAAREGQPSGLGLPPLLALVGAVALAGLAGALFSPISGRLRGIYLGLASLGLVFLGQHILLNATPVTGGYSGRNAEAFGLFGFTFANSDPADLVVLGVQYGGLERLWYLFLLLAAIAWWCARNLVRSRPGRAMEIIRDSEVAAGVMGVSVTRYKGAAFTVSSMYAGLAGVMTALAFGRIVPESFGLGMSVDFLVMITIGGIGSVGGAVAGAAFVTLLPLLLNHYSDLLPFLAQPGSGGLSAADLSAFVYGLAIVLVLLFAHDGLAGLGHRLGVSRRRPPDSGALPEVAMRATTTTKESAR
ncbi:branched-chain amino acid ABC transporter permease [Blastococcus sp. SYSU D00820]